MLLRIDSKVIYRGYERGGMGIRMGWRVYLCLILLLIMVTIGK